MIFLLTLICSVKIMCMGKHIKPKSVMILKAPNERQKLAWLLSVDELRHLEYWVAYHTKTVSVFAMKLPWLLRSALECSNEFCYYAP